MASYEIVSSYFLETGPGYVMTSTGISAPMGENRLPLEQFDASVQDDHVD